MTQGGSERNHTSRQTTGQSTVNRRRWISTAGTVGVIGLGGCVGGIGGGGSGKPDSIRYLGWGGNTQESAKKLFAKWSEESGVEVKHQSAGGDTEFVSIIGQNPGDIDIVNFSSYGIALAREKDLLSEIDYGELPNYTENMQESFQNAPYVKPDEESDTVFRDPVTQGYTYNTEQVSFEMTSWEDIIKPELKGKVALRDAALPRFGNASLAVGSNVNEVVSNDSAYQKTYERMMKEHENVFKYWGSGAQAIQFLREENAFAAEMWGGRTLALAEAGYDQMEYVLPEEGMFVLDENYNFPKSSNKTSTALELINWSFKRENAIELTKNLGYPLMIKNPPEAITSLPDYVDSIDQLSWPEWSTALDKQEQMTRDFQKIKQN